MEAMGPAPGKDELSSPWLDCLDQPSEGYEVLHEPDPSMSGLKTLR